MLLPFSRLNPFTSFLPPFVNTKILPNYCLYSNLNIDYKTDGIVPSAQTSTSSLTTTINIKVFLEGPFNGSNMNTDLNAMNLITFEPAI